MEKKDVKIMEPVHFRLSAGTMDKLRKRAKKERRQISQLIRILLDENVDKPLTNH